MKATLYGLELSHPSHTARLMLEHKGIEHRVVNMPPGTQPVVLRALGFRGATVPAMKIDGHRVQRSRAISRELDALVPEPPLFPADPVARQAVEVAEKWGDEIYQPVPRRIFRWSLTSDSGLRTFVGETMGLPAPAVASEVLRPVASVFARLAGADREQVEEDVRSLPDMLDHVDALIATGVIGTSEPNAADFQIATTTASLLQFDGLRPLVEGRPAAAHAAAIATGMDTEPVPVRNPLS